MSMELPAMNVKRRPGSRRKCERCKVHKLRSEYRAPTSVMCIECVQANAIARWEAKKTMTRQLRVAKATAAKERTEEAILLARLRLTSAIEEEAEKPYIPRAKTLREAEAMQQW